MNRGGFSWKRLTGISAAKSKISRSIGIPLTKSGRQRKLGRIVSGGGCLLQLILLLSVIILLPALALSKGGGHSGGHSSGSHSTSGHSSGGHSSSKAVSSGTHHGGKQKASGVKRDKKGKIARSAKAKDTFRKSHPCPSTGRTSGACPGYVIDHVKALKRGGADSPSNMQWQTKTDAKTKDKWE